jgi:hypothetical protein
MNPTTLALAFLLTLALVAAVIGACLMLTGAGLREFLNRPACWLFGHDLTHPLFDTSAEYRGKLYPATVYRCSRHQMLVTVITSPEAVTYGQG